MHCDNVSAVQVCMDKDCIMCLYTGWFSKLEEIVRSQCKRGGSRADATEKARGSDWLKICGKNRKVLMSKYRSQTSDSCCQHHRENQWQWLIWWIEILWRICVTDLNNKEACDKCGCWFHCLCVGLLLNIYVHHSSSSSSISLPSLVLLSDNLHQ